MGARADTQLSLRLYEWCVQSPHATARYLRAIHAGTPRTLREDFSGGAAICRAWLALDPFHRAIAVDHDRTVLRHAGRDARLKKIAADVLDARDRCDVLAAFNFPLGYWHSRGELLVYLRASRARLRRGGVFVADLYGGTDAFATGTTTRRVQTPIGAVSYHWEQRGANPVTGRVLNAIHFDLPGGRRLRDAFVYDWRLWSIPELCDACAEAGFRDVRVYDSQGGAVDQDGRFYARPIEHADELDENYVVYVSARNAVARAVSPARRGSRPRARRRAGS